MNLLISCPLQENLCSGRTTSCPHGAPSRGITTWLKGHSSELENDVIKHALLSLQKNVKELGADSIGRLMMILGKSGVISMSRERGRIAVLPWGAVGGRLQGTGKAFRTDSDLPLR